MTKGSPFKKLFESRQSPTSDPAGEPQHQRLQPELRRRGRPATGKRSDPSWIGRTYYVQRETDLNVEDALLRLKRQGVEVDKSELVDALLDTWVKWQQGEDTDFQLNEITPRRKVE